MIPLMSLILLRWKVTIYGTTKDVDGSMMYIKDLAVLVIHTTSYLCRMVYITALSFFDLSYLLVFK